jgi:hypothetical protein
MSYSNYNNYTQFKSFQEKIKGVYVCKSGDSMTGNLSMSCNEILNVENISFCNGTNYLDTIQDLSNSIQDLSNNIQDLSNNKYDKTGGLISGNVEIAGILDMSCNQILDVSGIFFCDGTYIGQGNSFDISTNEVLHIKTSQNVLIDGDVSMNNNLSVSELTSTKFADINYFSSHPLEGDGNSLIIKGGPVQMDIANIDSQIQPRILDGIYIGSKVGSTGDAYSILIGTTSGGGPDSYFNTSVGIFNDISGSLNGTTLMGYDCRSTGGESVGIGRKVRVTTGCTIVGSMGNVGNPLTTGIGNTFIGAGAGNNIITGNNNIALGIDARFSADVSNCLSINNQINSAKGGIYGINLGSDNFNLGINTNTPTETLDVSGNLKVNGNSLLNGNVEIVGTLDMSGNTIDKCPLIQNTGNDNGQDIEINAGGNINLVSGSNIELDCPTGVIDAKSGNFNLVNNDGGGSIILLDDVVDNIQMTIEASPGNTGLFTNDNLLLQCENLETLVRQGEAYITSDTNLLEVILAENGDGNNLYLAIEEPSITISSSTNLSLQCENMDTLVRQGASVINSDTNKMEMALGENIDGSSLQFIAEDPSAIIESNNNLSLRCENMDTLVRQGVSVINSDTNRMYMALGENIDGSSLQFIAEDPSAIIESNNNLSIISSGDLILSASNGNVTIDVTNNAGGEIALNGTDLISPTSGGNSGQHLVIRINGTQYKIQLEDP